MSEKMLDGKIIKIAGYEPDLDRNCYWVKINSIGKTNIFRLYMPVGLKVGKIIRIEESRISDYYSNLHRWFHLPLDT